MALATAYGDRKSLDILASQLRTDWEAQRIPEPVYYERKSKVIRVIVLLNNSDEINSTVVIWNNVANVGLTAFLPLALKENGGAPPILIDVPQRLQFIVPHSWLNQDGLMIWPGLSGSEPLTLVAAILLILIFGEIIPKKLAMRHSIWFITKTTLLIEVFHKLTSWLGGGLAVFADLYDIVTRQRPNS